MKWVQGPNMRSVRHRHGCFSAKEQDSVSRVYVFGGINGPTIYGPLLSSTEILNVNDLTWSNGPSLPFKLGNNAGVPSLDDQYKGFSVGGYTEEGFQPRHLENIYGLQTSNGNHRWVDVGSMNWSRTAFAVVNAPLSLLPSC